MADELVRSVRTSHPEFLIASLSLSLILTLNTRKLPDKQGFHLCMNVKRPNSGPVKNNSMLQINIQSTYEIDHFSVVRGSAMAGQIRMLVRVSSRQTVVVYG